MPTTPEVIDRLARIETKLDRVIEDHEDAEQRLCTLEAEQAQLKGSRSTTVAWIATLIAMASAGLAFWK